MRQNHRLPFPVHDTSDLKRAIKYVLRANPVDFAAQKEVIRQARALGRTDLLPRSWTNMTTTRQDMTLDEQLDNLADRSGFSAVQLKTVYLRGVNHFLTSDISYGSATMYGLARVQRFINEHGAVVDSDLVEHEKLTQLDCGIELSSGQFFAPDVVYASGEQIASLFSPGTVTAVTIDDNTLRVSGELGSLVWVYTLDTVTGTHYFDVQ